MAPIEIEGGGLGLRGPFGQDITINQLELALTLGVTLEKRGGRVGTCGEDGCLSFGGTN